MLSVASGWLLTQFFMPCILLAHKLIVHYLYRLFISNKYLKNIYILGIYYININEIKILSFDLTLTFGK